MEKPLSPLKTIRRYCWIRCANKSSKLVRDCKDEECPNFIYRMGRNPARTGIGVGTRGKNGRYLQKVTGSAGSSVAVGSPVGAQDVKVALGVPRASGGEISQGQIDLEARGRIEIKRLNGQELVITLKPEINQKGD